MSQMITRLVPDRSEDKITADYWQDVEPILEQNHAWRSQQQRSDWGRHVAEIPNVVLMMWLNEEWDRGNTGIMYGSKEFDEVIARKLQDPEWKYLRVDK